MPVWIIQTGIYCFILLRDILVLFSLQILSGCHSVFIFKTLAEIGRFSK